MLAFVVSEFVLVFKGGKEMGGRLVYNFVWLVGAMILVWFKKELHINLLPFHIA